MVAKIGQMFACFTSPLLCDRYNMYPPTYINPHHYFAVVAITSTVQLESFPRENFCQFHHLLSLEKILSVNFFSCVKDCIADMATFTTLAKILSLRNYYNTKIAELGENWQCTVTGLEWWNRKFSKIEIKRSQYCAILMPGIVEGYSS